MCLVMSAWVIALGLSAGYLINKNLAMASRLQESVTAYQEQADPDPELSSSEIRKVQRRVPDADRYDSMNLQDLPAEDVRHLQAERERAHAEVQEFEAGPPPIEGVYLVFDRGGV